MELLRGRSSHSDTRRAVGSRPRPRCAEPTSPRTRRRAPSCRATVLDDKVRGDLVPPRGEHAEVGHCGRLPIRASAAQSSRACSPLDEQRDRKHRTAATADVVGVGGGVLDATWFDDRGRTTTRTASPAPASSTVRRSSSSRAATCCSTREGTSRRCRTTPAPRQATT